MSIPGLDYSNEIRKVKKERKIFIAIVIPVLNNITDVLFFSFTVQPYFKADDHVHVLFSFRSTFDLKSSLSLEAHHYFYLNKSCNYLHLCHICATFLDL